MILRVLHRYYIIADATYALGISKFLINELGFIPKGHFVVDNPSEKYVDTIKKEFTNLTEDFDTSVIIETDSSKIHNLIREENNKLQKTLIIGSSWEEDIVKDIKGFLFSVSIPLNDQLVINRTYVGYNGGLNLIQDIYSTVIKENEKEVNSVE